MSPPTQTNEEGLGSEEIAAVLAVAELGGFRRAAIQIGVGQSAVSRRVRKLEDRIGISLFERSSTGARLTNAGCEFVSRARTIRREISAALLNARSAGTAKAGTLKVGTMLSFSEGPPRNLVQTFRNKCPRVGLYMFERGRGQMLTMLSHRALDAVFVLGEPKRAQVDYFVFAEFPIFMAVASDHRSAAWPSFAWADVGQEKFLVSDRGSGPDIRDFIIRNGSTPGRSLDIASHNIGHDGIMSLVGLGYGIAVVGHYATGGNYPNVNFVPLNETMSCSLIWRPENDNPALRRFISLARVEAKRNGALS